MAGEEGTLTGDHHKDVITGGGGTAGGAETRMNVAAVKRFDPYARDIVESATHVALYTFEDNEWDRTSIEGALFLYKRVGRPGHSLLIMNRLSTDNLLEPLTLPLEVQLQVPFLLYRNARKKIYGIWFYDKNECLKVASKVAALAKDTTDNNTEDIPIQPIQSIQPKADIFSMLSKAQKDYDTNKKQVTPRPPDGASQSVMDFFAKAGSGAGLPSAPNTTPRRPDTKEANPMILQRLMSDSILSVEHIEKQQRSVTPKIVPKTDLVKNGNAGDHRKKNKEAVDDEPDIKSLSLRCDSPKKPALMPPTMFTSSASKSTPAKGALPLELGLTPIRAPSDEPRPEPLTKNQLLQAFNYLIKNDAEFVTKLHEAYVKSFSELVS